MAERTGNFYEFFAGAGMARAGLGPTWECVFANDFDHKKAATYRSNWGGDELRDGDVRAVSTSELPGQADLVWASFPCQDLSLAGGGAGLKGERSGTFWPFWSLMKRLRKEGRAPRLIVLENVCGTLTSHGGKDFATICGALGAEGYRFGAVVIDAALFVPQSRPRLFVVGVHESLAVPAESISPEADARWCTRTLQSAVNKLSPRMRDKWVWWSFPAPRARRKRFADLIEETPGSVQWHTRNETQQLLGMMSEVNLAKVKQAQRTGEKAVGAVYKRTRRDEDGRKVQRAEVRFDDIAGCLRTPAGGSSRQLIVVVEGRRIRSRLISSRETARLMGLKDSYALPGNYNEAYHLTGDGVVVPVVRHLAKHVLEPLLASQEKQPREAA